MGGGGTRKEPGGGGNGEEWPRVGGEDGCLAGDETTHGVTGEGEEDRDEWKEKWWLNADDGEVDDLEKTAEAAWLGCTRQGRPNGRSRRKPG